MLTIEEINKKKEEIENLKEEINKLIYNKNKIEGEIAKDYLEKEKKRFAESAGKELERGDKVVVTTDYWGQENKEELYFLQFYLPLSYTINSLYIMVEFAKIKKDGSMGARVEKYSTRYITNIEIVK